MNRAFILLILLCLLLCLTACGPQAPAPAETVPAETAPAETGGSERSDDMQDSEGVSEDGSDENTETAVEEREPMLQMTIDDTPVQVEWENNDSVQALRQLCADRPLTVHMSMYGGFEQVGAIGERLPRNDEQTTTEAGDIVLYSGNQMVVFYGSNTWAYTRLGRITDKTAAELEELLGLNDVTVTISLED